MRYLANYSDLISAIFGIIGALILGIPLIGEVQDRRHWDQMVRFFRRKQSAERVERDKSEEEISIERRLRDQMIDIRLGEFESYKFVAFFGFACLLLSFGFLAVAAVTRSMAP
jgi:hypothetical protein